MIDPLGAYATARESPFPSKPAGLDVQLAQLQGQLADCVNCASARTPEGKAKIQEISLKIQSIKARMEAMAAARNPGPPAQAPVRNAPDYTLANPEKQDPASAPFTLGTLLDLST